MEPQLFIDPASGLNDEQQRARELARRYRCEYIELKGFKIQHELFRKVPVELMFRFNFIPLQELEDGRLAIALSDPSQLMVIDEISLLLNRRVVPRVATLTEITDILKKTEQSQRVLDEAGETFTLDVVHDDDATTDETISIEKLTQESDISPIIRLVDTTIFTALQRRASDIHVETRDDCVVIKYRIDGVLQEAMKPIAKDHHSTILSRIKVMSELDIAERRVPQDGRFRVRYNGRYIDLVTGPTGSGKTTTLYAALNEIKSDEDKIITIEDPVEYQLRGVTQIPVNEKKGLTFARGLRSILRHDPDKIMVGEIRDQETAQIAINSALTGHLVFTTVHANNVVDVIGRFLNMGVEPYNFVSSLNCILAQRLVRLICRHCKQEVQYSDDMLKAGGLRPEEWRGVPFYEGPGCIECGGTGFHGRTAIHELLDLTDHIRELILERRPSSEIRRAAREEGMQFLRESALEKVKAGISTLKEINKVTFIETAR